MNGFNGRGVLDRIPNGGTSLHSQVDFISNSLEWITKEMSKFKEEDQNLWSQFAQLEGAVSEMRVLMNSKKLTPYDSDTSVGQSASGTPSQSSLGKPVLHQYTESPRLGRKSRVSVGAPPGTPPSQPSPTLAEAVNGSPGRDRPSPPVPRRVAPPPPRRASVPAAPLSAKDSQTSPKPKPKLSPLQERVNKRAASQPPVPESSSVLAEEPVKQEKDKEEAPLGPESLSISLDTSMKISGGDLASDIFAALASKGLDL